MQRKKLTIVKKGSNQEKEIKKDEEFKTVKKEDNDFKFYKFQLKLLTPMHIGNGEIYEPTNFAIDEGYLYEFKDSDFYEALPPIKREAFNNILLENRSDSFVRIHKFIKENIDTIKQIDTKKVKVTNGVFKAYSKKVGNIVQVESSANIFNQFEIYKTIKKQIKKDNEYINVAYIPASSLKGAISTAYQEFIYKRDGDRVRRELFESKGKEITKNIFQNLKISDSKKSNFSTKIGFSLNRERFEEDNEGLEALIEVIESGSEFEFEFEVKTKLDIDEVLDSCSTHYLPIFKSMFEPKVKVDGVSKEQWINEYFSEEFYNKYKDFKLGENEYLIRIGKHSGARAVTIDGIREISVRESKSRFVTKSEETTTWLFGEYEKGIENLIPFGWGILNIEESK